MPRLHDDTSGMRVASLCNGGVYRLYDGLLFGEHVHARPIGPGMWHGRTRVRRLLGPDAGVQQRLLHVTAILRFIDAVANQ